MISFPQFISDLKLPQGFRVAYLDETYYDWRVQIGEVNSLWCINVVMFENGTAKIELPSGPTLIVLQDDVVQDVRRVLAQRTKFHVV